MISVTAWNISMLEIKVEILFDLKKKAFVVLNFK